jgi:hypothetical protein
VPEPASLVIFLAGVAAVTLRHRLRSRSAERVVSPWSSPALPYSTFCNSTRKWSVAPPGITSPAPRSP